MNRRLLGMVAGALFALAVRYAGRRAASVEALSTHRLAAWGALAGAVRGTGAGDADRRVGAGPYVVTLSAGGQTCTQSFRVERVGTGDDAAFADSDDQGTTMRTSTGDRPEDGGGRVQPVR